MLCCLLINLTCGISAGIKHIAMYSYRKLIHYRLTTVTALGITPHRHALFSYYNTYPCFIPYLASSKVRSNLDQSRGAGAMLHTWADISVAIAASVLWKFGNPAGQFT